MFLINMFLYSPYTIAFHDSISPKDIHKLIKITAKSNNSKVFRLFTPLEMKTAESRLELGHVE